MNEADFQLELARRRGPHPGHGTKLCTKCHKQRTFGYMMFDPANYGWWFVCIRCSYVERRAVPDG